MVKQYSQNGIVSVKTRAAEASLLISAVRNALWVLGVFASAAMTVFIYVGKYWRNSILLIAASLAASIVLLAIGIFIGAYTYRIAPMKRATELGYKVISHSIEYIFDDDDLRVQKEILTRVIEATNSPVLFVEFRYRWTGEGQEPEIHISPNVGSILIDPQWNVDGFQLFYVRLNSPLQQGERKEIKLRYDMIDEHRKFYPPISKYVNYWLGSLTITVRFPKDRFPNTNDFIAYKALAGVHKRVNLPLTIDNNSSSVTLQIEKPSKDWKYAVEWYWDYSC